MSKNFLKLIPSGLKYQLNTSAKRITCNVFLTKRIDFLPNGRRYSSVANEPEKPKTNEEVILTDDAPSTNVYNDEEGAFHENKLEDDVNIPIFLRLWRDYFVKYALITLGTISVIWILYDVTDWFSSMTIKGTAKYMFSSGLIVGLLLSTIAWRVRQFFTIRSASVYKAALRKVVMDERVMSKMKAPLKPAKFRAHAYEYPDMKNMYDVPLTRKLQFWKPPRMQMVFRVQDANNKQAEVFLEVSKRPGRENILSDRFKFHSLTVELPNQEIVNIKGEKIDYDPKNGVF
ncbi:DNA mismatch repair protein MutS [Acrasis kona]|uniref:DNA mismatch repair protein MutS n=1 Tax=Acrasis kona TaxID=1008807 RepID=A0AAW2YPM5_9EUKA